MNRKNIAIFASGAGTNAKKIIQYFYNNPVADVRLIVCNNPRAGVLSIAAAEKISSVLISKSDDAESLNDVLRKHKIDFIVLAGYLWLIPPVIVRNYKDRIINIHPSLLPKYGGKGMYGMKVHEAVKKSGDTCTGVTIHLVNEEFDKGKIVFQSEVKLDPSDSPEIISHKVQKLEHEYFAPEIEKIIKQKG